MSRELTQENIERYQGRDELFPLIVPFVTFRLLSNNIVDKYAIDMKLVRLMPNYPDKTVALIDLEERTGYDLGKLFSSIHVPLHDCIGERKIKRKKIETYQQNPYGSFHLVWQPEYNKGYLIQAIDVISSPIVSNIKSNKTGRILDCYDVPIIKCKEVKKEQIILNILYKLIMGRIE